MDMDWAYQVYEGDNVATALGELAAGSVQIRGGASANLGARETIPVGHKVALTRIPDGADVVKYGIRIGVATGDIEPGSWVHLHNMRSAYDERSSHLDVVTGAPTDTEYA